MNQPMVLDLRKFVAPEFVFGLDARFLAGRYGRNLGVRRVLVVTDPGIVNAGWAGDVISSLHDAGIQYAVFDRVGSDPSSEDVMDGAQMYASEGCNAIVAVGGGSPMDCAKGIGIVSSNKRHISEFEGADQVPVPGPPLICVPTTAGSSAEISQFAVITDKQRKIKMAIASKSMVPDAALLDPRTLVSNPPHLSACAGMDALSHAVEAYVSNASSAITDLHALEAIRIISGHLLPSIQNPGDLQLRGKMMHGSLLAGMAFSNAILGAVHAMAHSLGGLIDLPHGECKAILLRHVIAANFEAVPERYVSIGEIMGLSLQGKPRDESKASILEAFYQLQRSVGMDRSLKSFGVEKKDLADMARKAVDNVCMATNPRELCASEIEEIYERAL